MTIFIWRFSWRLGWRKAAEPRAPHCAAPVPMGLSCGRGPLLDLVSRHHGAVAEIQKRRREKTERRVDRWRQQLHLAVRRAGAGDIALLGGVAQKFAHMHARHAEPA